MFAAFCKPRPTCAIVDKNRLLRLQRSLALLMLGACRIASRKVAISTAYAAALFPCWQRSIFYLFLGSNGGTHFFFAMMCLTS